MAVNSKLISQNQIDTSYNANLLREQQIKEQQKQVTTPTSLPTENMQGQINTTYQANTGIQYGGHDASWWDEQYSAQADDSSKAMVAKAADYYGYKIPTSVNTNVTSYAANVASVQQAAPAQSEQGTTTPATTNSGTIDSYEEFLRKRAESYKENLDKQNTIIEEQKQNALEQTELQRQQAEQKAEQERQRGVIDARSSYEQNKASYGANAEALAGMGLTESGYSDYIDSQAYAAQRAETQAANAQSEQAKQNAQNIADATKLEVEQNATQNKLNAELTYAENMARNDAELAQYQKEQEEQKKAAYMEFLSYANNGVYSAEQIKELGKQYGLTDEQIEKLASAQQENTYKNYLEDITNGYADTDTVKEAYEKGNITTEQYNSIKEKWNKAIDTSESFFVYNGGTLDEASAKKALDAVINNEWCSAETKKALQESFDKTYETPKILAGKKYFKYNGTEYKIKSILKDDANEIKHNNSFTDKLKSLGFTNPFDEKIPNGTTFEIKVDAAGKDNPSAWNWIAGILTVGMSELAMGSIYRKTVTYYDGHWYVSEKV